LKRNLHSDGINTLDFLDFILELGSGCGLPGILATRYAKEVILTDYIEAVLENLRYNVSLNCSNEEFSCSVEKHGSGSTFSRLVRILHLNWDEIDNNEAIEILEPVDIIIGSELTYSPLSVDSLIKVICKYLKLEGMFLEVLSDDRDGVSLFLEKIQAIGFSVSISAVNEKYLGNFKTGQKPESYKLYIFRRKQISSSDHT